MQRQLFALTVIVTLAVGCRNAGNSSTETGGGNGEQKPPAVQTGNGSGSSNNGSATTDPGKIIDPTKDISAESESVGKMDMPELIEALGDEKLASAATNELASRGSEAVGPLIKALDSEVPVIRQRAIFTLSRLEASAQAALPKLREMAEDVDSELHRDAKWAIDSIEGN